MLDFFPGKPNLLPNLFNLEACFEVPCVYVCMCECGCEREGSKERMSACGERETCYDYDRYHNGEE